MLYFSNVLAIGESMDKPFNYETPPWGAKLICVIYFCVAVFFFSIYYNFGTWFGGAPVFIKYFILLLSIVFLLVALKPSNRKGWIYFSANNEGLYFPVNCQNKTSSALHVPWSRVGCIKQETLYNHTHGITIGLKLSDDEVNSYFKDLKMVNKYLGFNVKRNGFYVVGYANNAFQNKSDVVRTLNRIKCKSI